MIRIMGEVDVKLGLKNVLQKIEEACLKRIPELQHVTPTLVCVSKTKPSSMVVDVYEAGQRHFGENYPQELLEKAASVDIIEKCPDIKWHFIGHLQTNKINKILSLRNLYMIETVHSEKLAIILNKKWPDYGVPNSKLNVMVQINTSGEEEKNGVPPEQATNLTKFVLENCPNLKLNGLMTIGKFGYDPEHGPNPDFVCLKQCREEICKNLGLDWKEMHLSMGMSNDFEQAVEMGSSYVRVGSSIFGYRPRKL